MDRGAGYKRARPDPDFVHNYAGPPGNFGPPGGFDGGMGPDMGIGLGMGVGVGPVGMGLGTGPDGTFPLVKLRGLPFSAEEQDVRAFLEVDAVDVILVRRGGRLSGEAFVVLPGMLQTELALSKHKAYMGKRYVEVLAAKKLDYYRAVANALAENDVPSNGYDAAAAREGGGGISPGRNGRGHYDRPPARPDFMPAGPPMPMGGQMGGQMGMNNGGGMMGAMPMGGHRDGGVGPRDRGPPRALPRRGGPLPLAPMQRRHSEGPVGGGAGATGILKLRGLPFQASREDVAMWFNESGALMQPIDADSVHLVLAYDGRPTGNAFVEFLNPMDAKNAMVRDRQMLGNRYVELFASSRDEVAQATGQAYG